MQHYFFHDWSWRHWRLHSSADESLFTKIASTRQCHCRRCALWSARRSLCSEGLRHHSCLPQVPWCPQCNSQHCTDTFRGLYHWPLYVCTVEWSHVFTCAQGQNNLSTTWLIAFGGFTGGGLWLESPIGTHPPPSPQTAWEKNLWGAFHGVKNTWVCFDPQLYHAVEPITSASRWSLALFTPKNWKRLPPHCLADLNDIGLHLSHSALSPDAGPTSSNAAALPNSIHTSACATPTGSVATSTLTLADPLVRDVSSTSPLSSGACLGSSDLATLLFGLVLYPLRLWHSICLSLTMRELLQEWCSTELVSLPSASLPASDGAVMRLNHRKHEELSEHIRPGHSSKSNLCQGCLQAEGPRKIHRTIGDVDRATHTLHIYIAGPFTTSDDGFTYFLVGALRLPGFPLLIDVRLLTSRGSVEVCDALERMVAFFESLQSECFTITHSSRVKRLHSDRAGELTAPYFERFLTNHKSICHTFTPGYVPQSNGIAERTVGLVKSLAARALATAQLGSSYWSFSVRYAAQSLQCHALQRHQRSLPFGSSLVSQETGARLQEDQVPWFTRGYCPFTLLGSHARPSVIHSCSVSTGRWQHWFPGLPYEHSCTFASCNQHWWAHGCGSFTSFIISTYSIR